MTTYMPWLCLLLSCTPLLRSRPPADAEPLRHALGVRAPRFFARVDGVELAVHDSDPTGSKPALVCLHAIAHGGGDFDAVEDALSSQFRVVTIDWPGQGFSGDDAKPASAKRYAELFTGLVEQLKLSPFVLLGNSIGGAAAIRYSAAHPDQVRALVIADPGGLDQGSVFQGLFIGHYVGKFERGARDEASFGPWFSEYYDEILITPAAAERKAAIVAAGYETAPILVQAWQSFGEKEADIRALLPTLSMPVLVTWAKRDGIVQWSRSQAAIETIPHRTVAFFEAGHAAFLETPEPFIAELRSFLSHQVAVAAGSGAPQ